MFHYRKTRKIYKSYPKPKVCNFCDPETLKNIIHETPYSYIVPNRVFYDVWEMHNVTDHLLLMPKRHVHTFSELTDGEKLDIMHLVGEYESKEYNVYARASKNKQRSVSHQHTHLIKTHHKPARISLTIRRPYLLIKV